MINSLYWPSLGLLFVFWYCYKRGREERIKTEALAAEEAAELGESGDEEEYEIDHGLASSKKYEDTIRKPIGATESTTAPTTTTPVVSSQAAPVASGPTTAPPH